MRTSLFLTWLCVGLANLIGISLAKPLCLTNSLVHSGPMKDSRCVFEEIRPGCFINPECPKSCVDSDSKIYKLGELWLNPYGQMCECVPNYLKQKLFPSGVEAPPTVACSMEI